MKKPIYTLALALLVAAGTTLTSCGSSQEKVDEAKADIESAEMDVLKAKEDYYKEYNDFKTESDKQISDNSQRIIVLRKESSNRKKEEKEEYERKIADLEKRNEALQTKINEHKDDSKDGWESFKREFKHDMDELGQSITDIGKNNVK